MSSKQLYEDFYFNFAILIELTASWLKNILQRMADQNAMKWFNWWTMGLIAMGIIGVSAAAIVLGFKVGGV
jgi:hypothetical protein